MNQPTHPASTGSDPAAVGAVAAALCTASEMSKPYCFYTRQAFHDRGKDGVRVLMYEEMSKRLRSPLHIYIASDDGNVGTSYDEYGPDQPGEAIKLIREPTDLYRR